MELVELISLLIALSDQAELEVDDNDEDNMADITISFLLFETRPSEIVYLIESAWEWFGPWKVEIL